MTARLVRPAAPPRPPGDRSQRLSKSLAVLVTRAGYQTADQAAAAQAQEELRKQDERRARARSLKSQSGVLPRYAAARIRDTSFPEKVLSAEEFARYDEVRAELMTLLVAAGIVVLSGDNGPGKTHLACALVHEFCAEGRPAFYCRAIDFYRSLKSTFGQAGKTAEDLIARFVSYELLVIDEIEVRSDSAWENNELRSLLDARYGHMVSTVLITNKTRAELNGEDGNTPYLSKALRDRIRHEGGILECRWRSLRGEVSKP